MTSHYTSTWSDNELVGRTAQFVSQPRSAVADSFVLHSPLELAARAALLPWVDQERREQARQRIADIANQLDSYELPVATPPLIGEQLTVESVAQRLVEAISNGELDDTDATAHTLATMVTSQQLTQLLANSIIDKTAAAAHAPIFLYQLMRVSPRGELTPQLLRPLARELARHPDRHVEWIEELSEIPTISTGTGRTLFDAIVSAPNIESPEDDFIHPLIKNVDGEYARTQLLDAVIAAEPKTANKSITRIAALTMLQEDAEHAPYGWTHALTIPQAVVALAPFIDDSRRAVAIAATELLAFRSQLAKQPLEYQYAPEIPEVEWKTALSSEPSIAAAAVWHSPVENQIIAGELAARAAIDHDAHFVKYTLAAIDAANNDPTAARLYLAAAASLAALWHSQPRA